ncbi:galactosylgalactosylxylosylprotein 3-beta-glucuronosyltransferase sqv-8-like isoform X2 [Amblyomma americanum]
MLFRPFRFPRRTTTVFCSAATFLLLLFEVVPDPSSWSSEEPLSVYESAGPVRTADATVYVVTHTYLQATQAPDLMRLSQALMLAQANIFWVVVEAADQPSQTVRHIVRRSGLAAVHLAKRPSSTMNAALAWLRANATLPGVVYFANEHHTYDRRIFAQMARVRRVGVFPVGLIAENALSSPVVSRQGVVVGFHHTRSTFTHGPFSMDMASFAVNLELVLSARYPRLPKRRDRQAHALLASLGVHRYAWEPLAYNCTKVLVWHAKTESGEFPPKKILSNRKLVDTNIPILYKNVVDI